MSRHMEKARDRAGRLATVAGAAGLTAGLFTGDFASATALGTVAATGFGLLPIVLNKDADGQMKATAGALYAAPGVSLLAVLVAERVAAGVRLWEVAAVAAWTAGTWVLRPARLALGLLPAPAPGPDQDQAQEPQDNAAPVVVDQVQETHPLARWWAENVGREGGIAPGTRLADPERTGPSSMRGVITSTTPGEPVPAIDTARLSARMDVPEDLISISPVPGRGAGVRLLTVGTAPMDLTPEQEWAQIASAALPGTTLLEVKTYPAAGGPVDLAKEEA